MFKTPVGWKIGEIQVIRKTLSLFLMLRTCPLGLPLTAWLQSWPRPTADNGRGMHFVQDLWVDQDGGYVGLQFIDPDWLRLTLRRLKTEKMDKV
jgi:hypothetical protein